MSELKRYTAVNPYEQPSESEHGEYYLADDVDKRIEELKQRNKDLERALRMSTCKFDTDNDGNCHLCVGKGCFRERLLKGGE